MGGKNPLHANAIPNPLPKNRFLTEGWRSFILQRSYRPRTPTTSDCHLFPKVAPFFLADGIGFFVSIESVWSYLVLDYLEWVFSFEDKAGSLFFFLFNILISEKKAKCLMHPTQTYLNLYIIWLERIPLYFMQVNKKN